MIQWDKYWKKENNSDSESNSNNIDELGDNLDESDEDLEIVSIRPTFVQKLDDALKRSSESQTDPVQVRISEVLGWLFVETGNKGTTVQIFEIFFNFSIFQFDTLSLKKLVKYFHFSLVYWFLEGGKEVNQCGKDGCKIISFNT